jgi:hypothetical protein
MYSLKDLEENKHYLVTRKTTGETLEIIVIKKTSTFFSKKVTVQIYWVSDKAKCWMNDSNFDRMYNILYEVKIM